MTAISMGPGEDRDDFVADDEGNSAELPPAKLLSSFSYRSSVYSRDYVAGAPDVAVNSRGAHGSLPESQPAGAYHSSSPRRSIQRHLLPNGGVDFPDEGLAPRPYSYSSPRRSVQRDLPPTSASNIPEEAPPGYRRTSISPRRSVQRDFPLTSASKSPEEAPPGYRRTSISPGHSLRPSPRPSSPDIGLLPDGVPRFRLSTSWTSNGGNAMLGEDLPTYSVSTTGTRTSNGSSGVPNGGFPSDRESNSFPLISNNHMIIDDRSQSFRVGSAEDGLPAFRTSSPIYANGNQRQDLPAHPSSTFSDRISSVRMAELASSNSINLSSGDHPATIESSSTFSRDMEEFSNDMKELETNLRDISVLDAPPVVDTPPVDAPSGSRNFTSRSSKGNRALIVPPGVPGGVKVGLPRVILPAEQVGQQVPFPDDNCLTHQCCVKVVCICDPDGHPHPIGVEPANPVEQAQSSRRYDYEPFTSRQEGCVGNLSGNDTFPVRSNGTSSSRFYDGGSTSSGRDRRKLKPITRVQVSSFSKVSQSLLQCQPESGVASMH